MFDLITSIVLALFGLIIALDAFLKWRKNKSIWLILALIMAALSAMAAFVNWSDTLYGLVLALILYLIGRRKKN